MKGLRGIVLVLFTTCALQACNHVAKNYNSTSPDSPKVEEDTSDDDDASSDTSTTLNLAVDKEDSQFAVEAINGGTTEVTLGKLAIQRGKSKKVKNFGTMMVKDHSKANDKLMVLIKSKKIALPMTPDPAQQKMIQDLSQKSGSEFDKAYIKAMIDDHQEDVKTFTEETKKLQDPDLKNFAIKTLPILQKHLDAINAIHDSMGDN
jgi:putative membrane protein